MTLMFTIPMAICNMTSGYVAIRHGIHGPNLCHVSACATGAHSIGEAARAIARGDVDAMLAGGTEAPIAEVGIAGFASMRALSTRNDAPARACRPFDKDRDGFIIGEGAGILILEELGVARRRDATIYAELVGYGLSSDAYHVTGQPEDANGAVRSMQMALRKAGLQPDAIDYINAHGTSTPINDPTETLAVKRTFGAHAHKLVMSSTKSMTGHLLGAAGGLEAGITALAVRDQLAPPTINLDAPDPACDLDYAANASRSLPIRYALSNSFGFGGTNGTLLFGKYTGE